MLPLVIDISVKTLFLAALVVALGGLAVFGGVLYTASAPQPQILEGGFVHEGGSGFLAV